MGNNFCKCNFLDENESAKEENITTKNNPPYSIVPGDYKLKEFNFIFNVNNTLIPITNNNLLKENDPDILLKQIYILNRLKFLSKKIRNFLISRKIGQMNINTITSTYEMQNTTPNNNRLNTFFSMNEYVKLTDTGDIAYKNLSSINNTKKIRDAKKKYIKNETKNSKGLINIKFIDNSEFEGYIENNTINGIGRFLFSDKDLYTGEFYEDKAKGYGIYYFLKPGCAYEGLWNNNYKSYIGIETWWYGAKYEGEFENGKKNGIGIYKWKDGSIYYGEWMGNYINGYGIFNNKNKKIYKGQFVMNSLCGYGEMSNYVNGNFYYGNWNKNKKNGFGVEFSPRNNGNDKLTIGFWKDNFRHGYCMLLNKNSDENNRNIFALWKNNKINKQYSQEEFFQVVERNGFEKYLFFFTKTYAQHLCIIGNIKNYDD